MKFFLISDNIDTEEGMRLAGIEGVVTHEAAEVSAALDKAAADSDVAVILVTEKLVTLCREKIYAFKLGVKRPLVVEIPDRHGTSKIGETISRYISEAIGVKL